MSRKTARRNAFIICFQMSFYCTEELERVREQFYSENLIGEEDEEYITRVVTGVFENIGEIDGLIQNNSNKWDVERIARVDMAIMRVSVFELLKMKEIPENVSVNEAVELAKRFGTDESPGFINGVLGGILKNVER